MFLNVSKKYDQTHQRFEYAQCSHYKRYVHIAGFCMSGTCTKPGISGLHYAKLHHGTFCGLQMLLRNRDLVCYLSSGASQYETVFCILT